jgi:glycosyltransferase involved in cell wall biosynthesis
MKKISVIIPVYNAEKYVAAAVESVLSQTYNNIELLIIDDGSPDKSIEVCQQFTDPRIKIIRQANKGVSAARNTGIHHAKGDYIAFLDADDIWTPSKLEKHVEHFANSSEVGISFSRSELINEAGQLLNIYQMPKLKNIEVLDLLYSNLLGNGSSGVFRKEVFVEIAFKDNCSNKLDCFFDTNFTILEDIECWLRIALQTEWKFEGIPFVLTLYRVNLESRSGNLLKAADYWKKIDNKMYLYSPELIRKFTNQAMAYRLRDLAREAVRRQVGDVAVKLINQALVFNWRLILIEPTSTILTLLMSYLLWLMPKSIYFQIEQFILKIKGFIQRRKILQQEFGK